LFLYNQRQLSITTHTHVFPVTIVQNIKTSRHCMHFTIYRKYLGSVFAFYGTYYSYQKLYCIYLYNCKQRGRFLFQAPFTRTQTSALENKTGSTKTLLAANTSTNVTLMYLTTSHAHLEPTLAKVCLDVTGPPMFRIAHKPSATLISSTFCACLMFVR